MTLPSPSARRPLDLALSPTEVFRRWPVQERLVALISGGQDASQDASPDAGPDASPFASPYAGHSLLGVANGQTLQAPEFGDPHQALIDLQSQLQADPDALWVGYLSYDLGRRLDPAPPPPRHADRPASPARCGRAWPLLHFAQLPGYLLYDHAQGQWSACGTWANRAWRCPVDARPRDTTGWLQTINATHTENDSPTPHPFPGAVRRVQRLIAEGDVFQVNLAHQLTMEAQGDPRALMSSWLSQHPARYAAYLPFIDDAGPARALVSGSPELFLERDGDRVCTRPIKGTRPADASAQGLLDSAKDAAELHMIVDLMRNDLGRVCRLGTVRVTEPRAIETHPTVHHGVATLKGRLRPNTGLADLLKATFPGGSITGAPKLRAIQIIEALEPMRRGPYCGAIGWCQGERAVFSIAIRTAAFTAQDPADHEHRYPHGQEHHHQADPANPPGSPPPTHPVPPPPPTPPTPPTPTHWTLDYGVGGGIVADSDAWAEYQETRTKAQAFLQSLAHCPPSPEKTGSSAPPPEGPAPSGSAPSRPAPSGSAPEAIAATASPSPAARIKLNADR